MRVAVIGGVRSTEVLINKLAEHGFDDVHVWGYTPTDASLVSGWVDLRSVASQQTFGFTPFVRVRECASEVASFAPDVLFAVGLSQIVPPDILSSAGRAAIGFHPTALPKGRGRAAIAWLVLNAEDGAATFFEMREGVDDGPIYVQEPYTVTSADDACSVEAKLLAAEQVALDRWLPVLRREEFSAAEQDHVKASWYARRAPEDGWLDWSWAAGDLHALVRASTSPHPGAVTACGDVRITVWGSSVDDRPITGVLGRIVSVESDGSFAVQTGDGLLRVSDWSAEGWVPKVGVRLGYDPQREIHRLRARCEALEKQLVDLAARVGSLTRDQD